MKKTKAKIRFDRTATFQGRLGGLYHRTFGQHIEFTELMEGTWDELRDKARRLAEIYFKPVHPFDGDYIEGIVLVEWLDFPLPFRTSCFRNPYI